MHKKFRELIIKCANKSKSSHTGSVLSIVEILKTLYFKVTNINNTTIKIKNAIFQNTYPERYLNMGIAEQNFIAVATGMKLNGL